MVLGVYKIPGFADIPGEFNVSLLKGAPNPRAVYSSKAVGEPPLFLASSIFFAIREAIKSARKDEGLNDRVDLISPATSARIRMACQDRFTREVRNKSKIFTFSIYLTNYFPIFSSQNPNQEPLRHGMLWLENSKFKILEKPFF